MFYIIPVCIIFASVSGLRDQNSVPMACMQVSLTQSKDKFYRFQQVWSFRENCTRIHNMSKTCMCVSAWDYLLLRTSGALTANQHLSPCYQWCYRKKHMSLREASLVHPQYTKQQMKMCTVVNEHQQLNQWSVAFMTHDVCMINTKYINRHHTSVLSC